MCINSNYTMSIFFIYARTPHKTLTDICSCQGMHDSLRRKKLSSNIQIKIKLEQELMFWNLATFGCLDRHQNSLIMNRICNVVVLELFLPFSLHIMIQICEIIIWDNYFMILVNTLFIIFLEAFMCVFILRFYLEDVM